MRFPSNPRGSSSYLQNSEHSLVHFTTRAVPDRRIVGEEGWAKRRAARGGGDGAALGSGEGGGAGVEGGVAGGGAGGGRRRGGRRRSSRSLSRVGCGGKRDRSRKWVNS